MSESVREVDPNELRLPPSRASGADPWKLHLQIRVEDEWDPDIAQVSCPWRRILRLSHKGPEGSSGGPPFPLVCCWERYCGCGISPNMKTTASYQPLHLTGRAVCR